MRNLLRKSDANPMLLWVALSLFAVGMTALVENCSYCGRTRVGKTEQVVVSGRVYIMGNEPFTEVAIEAEGGKVYVLHGEKADGIRKLQERIIEIKGSLLPRQSREKGVHDVIVVKSYKQVIVNEKGRK